MSIPSGRTTCSQEGAKFTLRPERGLRWLEQRVKAVFYHECGERGKGRICRTFQAMEFILILRAKRH